MPSSSGAGRRPGHAERTRTATDSTWPRATTLRVLRPGELARRRGSHPVAGRGARARHGRPPPLRRRRRTAASIGSTPRSLDARRAGIGDDGAGPPEAFSAGPGSPVERLIVTDISLVALGRGSVSTFDRETGSPLSRALRLRQRRRGRAAADGAARRRHERASSTGMPGRAALACAPERDAANVAADGASEDAAADGEPTPPSVAAEEQRIRRPPDGGRLRRRGRLPLRRRSAVASGRPSTPGDLPGVEPRAGPLLAVAGHDGDHHRRRLDPRPHRPRSRPTSRSGPRARRDAASPSRRSTPRPATRLEIVPIDDDGPGRPTRLSDARRHPRAGLERARQPRPRPGRGARGRSHRLRRRAARQRGLRRRAAARSSPRASSPTPSPTARRDDRGQLLAIAPDGRAGQRRHRRQRLRLAAARHAPGGARWPACSTCWRACSSRAGASRVFAAVLVLVEGMLFANARIAMNDVYVTTFIVVAALLFTPVYLGAAATLDRRGPAARRRAPLGLALASKWVALYAIGGLVLLVLLRSALGRVSRSLGMVALTAVLGAIAIRPAPVERPEPQLDLPRADARPDGAPRGGHRPSAPAVHARRGSGWPSLGPLMAGVAARGRGRRSARSTPASGADRRLACPLLDADAACLAAGVLRGRRRGPRPRHRRGLVAWRPRPPRGPAAPQARPTAPADERLAHPGRWLGCPGSSRWPA